MSESGLQGTIINTIPTVSSTTVSLSSATCTLLSSSSSIGVLSLMLQKQLQYGKFLNTLYSGKTKWPVSYKTFPISFRSIQYSMKNIFTVCTKSSFRRILLMKSISITQSSTKTEYRNPFQKMDLHR